MGVLRVRRVVSKDIRCVRKNSFVLSTISSTLRTSDVRVLLGISMLGRAVAMGSGSGSNVGEGFFVHGRHTMAANRPSKPSYIEEAMYVRVHLLTFLGILRSEKRGYCEAQKGGVIPPYVYSFHCMFRVRKSVRIIPRVVISTTITTWR
jgi:hypothetical protein